MTVERLHMSNTCSFVLFCDPKLFSATTNCSGEQTWSERGRSQSYNMQDLKRRKQSLTDEGHWLYR